MSDLHGSTIRTNKVVGTIAVQPHTEPTFMNQRVMVRTERNQILQTGFTAFRPMNHMVRINVSPMVATR